MLGKTEAVWEETWVTEHLTEYPVELGVIITTLQMELAQSMEASAKIILNIHSAAGLKPGRLRHWVRVPEQQ